MDLCTKRAATSDARLALLTHTVSLFPLTFFSFCEPDVSADGGVRGTPFAGERRNAIVNDAVSETPSSLRC